jgi:uroporphyrinogen III methyltransferase/synthase
MSALLGTIEGPLTGVTVAVTRAPEQSEQLVTMLLERGAEVLPFPTIQIADPEDPGPLDEAIRHLEVYSWVVFTSANAVDRFFARLYASGRDARHVAGLRVACVGPATAAACERNGIRADYVAEKHVGEALAEGLLARGVRDGSRVLLPRAEEAREVLPDALRQAGALVDVVVAYRTVPGPGDPATLAALEAGEVDYVTFTSGSTVRNFVSLAPGADRERLVAACVGPVTARVAREAGFATVIEPVEYTAPALVEAIERHARRRPFEVRTD